MQRLQIISFAAMILIFSRISDAQVELVWLERYDGSISSTDRGFDIEIDDLGNMFVAGFTTEAQGVSYLVIKYAPDGTRTWVNTTNPGIAHALTLDDEGNVIAVGSANFGQDFGIMKLDGNGDLLWTRTYDPGSGSLTEFDGVVTDATGAIYAYGNHSAGSAWSLILVKYAADGTFLWDFIYSSPSSRGDDIAIADDGVYVVGNAEVASNDEDLLVLKVSLAGTFLWQHTSGRTGNFTNDGAVDVEFDSSGNVVVAGTYSFNNSPTGSADIAVLRLQPDGTLISEVEYNGPLGLSDGSEAMVLDNNDNAIIAATTEELTGFDDVLVVKLDPTGSEIWANTYAGEPGFFDLARDIAIDHQGDVYVVGEVRLAGFITEYFTIKYNAAGTLEWEQLYGGAEHNPSLGMAVAVGADRGVAVTGYSRAPGEQDDAVTLRYSQLALTGAPTEGYPSNPARKILRVFPNPAGHRAEFWVDPTLDPRMIDIFDVKGRLVASIDATRVAPLQWGPDRSAGIYFARIRANGRQETVKFVLLK